MLRSVVSGVAAFILMFAVTKICISVLEPTTPTTTKVGNTTTIITNTIIVPVVKGVKTPTNIKGHHCDFVTSDVIVASDGVVSLVCWCGITVCDYKADIDDVYRRQTE